MLEPPLPEKQSTRLPGSANMATDHFLAAIVASSDDAIFAKTLDGIITSWNPAAERLYGYTADEAIGQHISLIVPPDRADELATIMARLRNGQRIDHIETQRVRKDGERRYISLSISPIFDDGGRLVGAASIGRDITERVDARIQQAWLAAIVESAADGILSVDRGGTILSWNDGAEQIYGYPADEAIGQSVVILRPLESEEEIAERVERVWQGDTVTELEATRLTRDGRRVPVSLTLFPIRNLEGDVVAVASISRDLTELRQIEAALLLRDRALDASRIGIAIADSTLPDHPVIDANPAFTRLTGYPREAVLGRNCRFLQGPETDPVAVKRIRKALAAARDCHEILLNYRQDGTPFWNDLSIAAVRDTSGAVTHFMGVLSDATERKRTEQELQDALEAAQAANRAKGEFLDQMSHELRTPLQATLGYSEFLLAGPEASLTTEQREDVTAIHQASQRMLALVNQMLDLSRTDAGHLQFAREPVYLAQVVEQVRQDIAPQAMAKGLTLQLDVSDSLPPAAGDAERVRQILLNLASNAVKFTPAGTVRIRTGVTNTGVMEIEVSDTGIGISADALPYIFTEFYREESRISRQHEGARLGLAISRKLATQMGGSIQVWSVQGVGSTFRLYLPLWHA